ncbi:hypothetical protein [Pseudomonas vlassakiae]|uniref:Uncharacterized protein n=1 Tax=Pseudomonas vlassakiae TaxID=485888 RepID=A0A923K5G3_9PSED|nr:hypothetical protein [Pseudomonas vlassakiae]MBV4542557.1 hypothetical protein [Pseudomonas vlassakiae]
MVEKLPPESTHNWSSGQRWEMRNADGNWQLLEEDFDPAGLEAIGDGLWMFPAPHGAEHSRSERSLFGEIFRVSAGLMLENPESQRRPQQIEGWGERVLDDAVPGTEIYIDDRGKYVFRHIGANHVLLDNTARYEDGSVGKETTLTLPDGRIFHASGHTVYPDGRSLNRRTGVLSDLGGNLQHLERRADGEWDVPAAQGST